MTSAHQAFAAARDVLFAHRTDYAGACRGVRAALEYFEEDWTS